MSDLLRAIILGIVEGLTEFLPVSSTGHLLLCERWMGVDLDNDRFWKMFSIFIQIGAIMAVVVYFWQRIIDLLRGRTGSAGDPMPLPASDAGARVAVRELPPRNALKATPLLLVIVGTLPVLMAGPLVHGWVEKNMQGSGRIAMALLAGGLVMLAVEAWRPAARTRRTEDMSLAQALWVGCVQILAVLFPGTSRSAATIVGGMLGGLSRQAAAEFSFFLAIPAMFAATSFSLLKHLKAGNGLTLEQGLLLAVGTLVSFLVAWAVIGAFMAFIRRRSFVPFAIYRILLAGLVFWLAR
jgi:undecaprenyl-diphosphatase